MCVCVNVCRAAVAIKNAIWSENQSRSSGQGRCGRLGNGRFVRRQGTHAHTIEQVLALFWVWGTATHFFSLFFSCIVVLWYIYQPEDFKKVDQWVIEVHDVNATDTGRVKKLCALLEKYGYDALSHARTIQYCWVVCLQWSSLILVTSFSACTSQLLHCSGTRRLGVAQVVGNFHRVCQKKLNP